MVIDPNGQPAKSPMVNCAPDLTRTPLRSAKRRTIVLRAPSTELKAVWQNLLTRQIFIVNSTMGSALNSPLESPDIMISQLSDVNLMANSIASIKMSSFESINNRKNQQVSNLIINSTRRCNSILFFFHSLQLQAKNNNIKNRSNVSINNSVEIVGNSSKQHSEPKLSSLVSALVTAKESINKSSSSNERNVESSPEMSRTMERFIDEKCNLLSKRGISKGGTVHLARWMKGQFDKQVCASEPIESDDEEDTEWSLEDVKRRSNELNLNQTQTKVEETTSEDEQNEKSASKSTTSDSQVSLVPKFLFSK